MLQHPSEDEGSSLCCGDGGCRDVGAVPAGSAGRGGQHLLHGSGWRCTQINFVLFLCMIFKALRCKSTVDAKVSPFLFFKSFLVMKDVILGRGTRWCLTKQEGEENRVPNRLKIGGVV